MRKIISSMLSLLLLISFSVGNRIEASTINGQDVVDEAMKYLGIKYSWGGKDPRAFDCSGLTSYVYGQLGVRIPGYISAGEDSQRGVGTKISNISELKPGDLVITYNYGHVGIYVGDGNYINSPQEGDIVRIMPIRSFNEGRRILGSDSSSNNKISAKFTAFVASDETAYYESGSNNDSLIRGYLNAGDVVECYYKEGSWYYTSMGYIYETRLNEMPLINNFTIDYDGAPYYSSGSNDDSLIIGRANKGEQITVQYKSGDWYYTNKGWFYKTAITPIFKQYGNFRGYIVEDNSPYYSAGSNDDSLIQGYLNAGDVVECYYKEGSWYYTSEGYIYESRLREMPYTGNFTIDYDGAPCYSAPSNDDSLIISTWNKGNKIIVDERSGNWYHTTQGWVYKTAITPVFR